MWPRTSGTRPSVQISLPSVQTVYGTPLRRDAYLAQWPQGRAQSAIIRAVVPAATAAIVARPAGSKHACRAEHVVQLPWLQRGQRLCRGAVAVDR